MAYASSDALNRSTSIRCCCARRQGCSLCTNMRYRRSSLTRKELDQSGMRILCRKLHMTETPTNPLLLLASGAFPRPSTVGRSHNFQLRRSFFGHVLGGIQSEESHHGLVNRTTKPTFDDSHLAPPKKGRRGRIKGRA